MSPIVLPVEYKSNSLSVHMPQAFCLFMENKRAPRMHRMGFTSYELGHSCGCSPAGTAQRVSKTQPPGFFNSEGWKKEGRKEQSFFGGETPRVP
jgi:hypothetical protein